MVMVMVGYRLGSKAGMRKVKMSGSGEVFSRPKSVKGVWRYAVDKRARAAAAPNSEFQYDTRSRSRFFGSAIELLL
jgi:hypothetical protein